MERGWGKNSVFPWFSVPREKIFLPLARTCARTTGRKCWKCSRKNTHLVRVPLSLSACQPTSLPLSLSLFLPWYWKSRKNSVFFTPPMERKKILPELNDIYAGNHGSKFQSLPCLVMAPFKIPVFLTRFRDSDYFSGRCCSTEWRKRCTSWATPFTLSLTEGSTSTRWPCY